MNKGMATGQNHTLQRHMVFWSSVQNSEGFRTKPSTWKKWLHTANAFNNKRNHRSYAQVVAGNQTPRCYINKKIVGQNIKKIRPVHGLHSHVKIRPAHGLQRHVANNLTWGKKDTENLQGQRSNSVYQKRSSAQGSSNTKNTPKTKSQSHDQIISIHNKFAPLQKFLDNESTEAVVQKDPETICHTSSNTGRNTVKLPCKQNKQIADKVKHQFQGHSPVHDIDRKENSPPYHDATDISQQCIHIQANTSDDNCDFDTSSPREISSDNRIPQLIWDDRYQCSHYSECMAQMTVPFGFIPITSLQEYHGPPIHWQTIPDMLKAYKIITESGLPNFMKCRIPVQTHLKPQAWEKYLTKYWDRQIVDLITFGFPLDFDRSCPLIATCENHSSAIQHLDEIDKYIQEELCHQAILGPFDKLPFHLHFSPLMTRTKQNSSKRRTIMDLSWPKEASVNAGVKKNIYLDTYFKLYYPSIDNITAALRNLGPGAMIYKIDISRAFRHLRIDPRDIDLLGLSHYDAYIDVSLPFGFRHGSIFFQRCSDAIRYIMKEHGFPGLWNYIDDLIYTGLPSKIHDSFAFLLRLLPELGLDISMDKLVQPSTSAVCLGILIDSKNQTISIPPDKLQQIVHMCSSWSNKKSCTKTQFQSLLGSLLYITKCVHPARYFLNRMLQILRDNHNSQVISLNQHFHCDLNWFNTFLKSYNGVTFYHQPNIQHAIHLDACLTGLGGCYNNMIYTIPIPEGHEGYNINHLEMINIMVALKIWGTCWSNQCVQIFCDNLPVVELIRTGRARDHILAMCARNIWLLSAIYNIRYIVSHISGHHNTIADLLSRWYKTPNNHEKLTALLPIHYWIPVHMDLMLFNTKI